MLYLFFVLHLIRIQFCRCFITGKPIACFRRQKYRRYGTDKNSIIPKVKVRLEYPWHYTHANFVNPPPYIRPFNKTCKKLTLESWGIICQVSYDNSPTYAFFRTSFQIINYQF